MFFLRRCPFAVRRLSFTESQFLLLDIAALVWYITLMWHTYHTRQNAVGTERMFAGQVLVAVSSVVVAHSAAQDMVGMCKRELDLLYVV